MLISNGASTKNIIYNKSIEALIQENLPTIDLSKIQVSQKSSPLQSRLMT